MTVDRAADDAATDGVRYAGRVRRMLSGVAVGLVAPAAVLAGCQLAFPVDDYDDGHDAETSRDATAFAEADTDTDAALSSAGDARSDGASDGDGDGATDSSSRNANDASDADAAARGDGGCVVATYVASVSADSPIAYYRLDETSGTTAKDATGMYNGVFEGGVTLGAAGVLPDDTAVTLDGVDGVVRVDGGPSFDGMAPFTLEAWIKPAAGQSGYRGIVSNQSPSASSKSGFDMYMGPPVDAGRATAGFERFASGASNPVAVPGAIDFGAWSHVLATFDGTSGALYVNGAQIGTTKPGTPISIPGSFVFVIGALNSAAQPTFFSGSIDEVAVYNHPLTARCILAHYHLGTGQSP